MRSMSDVVIRAEVLGKRYRIGRHQAPYKTLRESLTGLVLAPARGLRAFTRGERSRPEPEILWALKDVDLEVRRGEVLGIIGRNGAGKSTLLKILARITEPTTGRVKLWGRVGSLLEVGTGFHPELTGKENIYLNGAILGMRKGEIDRRFDEIVAFAEIERFLDTPVKRYSSGMYVRLAFAVAAHLEPEILLVDEVLAVGDAGFQKKCLAKMSDLARSDGRAVLVVSHNVQLIRLLCPKTMWIEAGAVRVLGSTMAVVSKYFAAGPAPSPSADVRGRVDRTGTRRLTIEQIRMISSIGEETTSFAVGDQCTLELDYRAVTPGGSPAWAISLFDALGVKVCHLDSVDSGSCLPEIESFGCVEVTVPVLALSPGQYSADVRVMSGGEVLDYIQGAFSISVEPGDFYRTGRMTPAHDAATFLRHSWSERSIESKSN